MLIIPKRKIITALLVIIFTTILVGCVDQSQVAKPVDSPFVTKSASEIGMKIDDLSVGWEGSGSGNETYFTSTFTKERIGITHWIESKVTKYSTIDEAKQAFYNLKKENSDFKLVSVGLGDESFAWEYGRESTVTFRKANIIVETWYGKQVGTGNIGDAKEYAEIVEKKI